MNISWTWIHWLLTNFFLVCTWIQSSQKLFELDKRRYLSQGPIRLFPNQNEICFCNLIPTAVKKYTYFFFSFFSFEKKNISPLCKIDLSWKLDQQQILWSHPTRAPKNQPYGFFSNPTLTLICILHITKLIGKSAQIVTEIKKS